MADKMVEFLYQNEQKLADVKNRLAINTRLGSLDLLEVLIAHLQLQNGMNLLDVGCGTGQHLQSIAQRCDLSLWGIDPSIEDGRSGKVIFQCGSAESLPFEDGTFHRVMCNYALYYVDEWQRAVGEMLRIARPEGRIVISGPAKDNNEEFYGLHRRLFGEISAIDLRGLHFLSDDLEPYLSAQGISFLSDVYENRVAYQQESDFIDYYTSTSLFRITSQGQDAEKMIQRIRDAIHPVYEQGRVFENVKKIKIITIEKG